MHRFVPILWLQLASCVAAAGAPELSATRGWLHLNGYTHHFDAPDANDNLFGLGGTWYAGRCGALTRAWETDVFRDSGRKLSAYIGHSWTLPLQPGSISVTGALMYHRNFARETSLRVLPVALPFWETRGESLKLRVYYIPPVRNHCDHQIAFQLMTPFWRQERGADVSLRRRSRE